MNDVAQLLSIDTPDKWPAFSSFDSPKFLWQLGPQQARLQAPTHLGKHHFAMLFGDDGLGGEIHHRAPHWVLFLDVQCWRCLQTLHKFVKEIYWVGLCRTTQGNHAHGLHNINFPLTCNRCVSIFLDLRHNTSVTHGGTLGMESSERIWVRWLSTNI